MAFQFNLQRPYKRDKPPQKQLENNDFFHAFKRGFQKKNQKKEFLIVSLVVTIIFWIMMNIFFPNFWNSHSEFNVVFLVYIAVLSFMIILVYYSELSKEHKNTMFYSVLERQYSSQLIDTNQNALHISSAQQLQSFPNFCPHCGTQISNYIYSENPDESPKFCPFCGESLYYSLL
ncbi:MAG: zinc ribbon domain-containing protein [Candidatus Lokiarchaeota archaeon]|nr:zinc ribbon domain-containing protein [Candidatus Harpocratesius repetitus]